MLKHLNGALLIDKPDGISSFDVIAQLRVALKKKHLLKRRELPKLGHGGTLDPFATGLLVVLVGRASKLAQFLLDSPKTYSGEIEFGKTTLPGDPTEEVSHTSERVPESIDELRHQAHQMTLRPYEQIPPMHSAKKVDGKRLYELARKGIEVQRKSKTCYLYQFEIPEYRSPRASFLVKCSSGTYIRKLSQDFAEKFDTYGMLNCLRRVGSGHFQLKNALSLEETLNKTNLCAWDELPSWIPFNQILMGGPFVQITSKEKEDLFTGRLRETSSFINRIQTPKTLSYSTAPVGFFFEDQLCAVASYVSQEELKFMKVFSSESI